MAEKEYYITFNYDATGRGNLELHNDSLIPVRMPSRTGSINTSGDLVNACPVRTWYICSPPVDTTEAPMTITAGNGWKVRLYIKNEGSGKYESTRYLLHPDGGKPGSEGCVVFIGDDGLLLKERIGQILGRQPLIRVHVTRKGQSNENKS